MGGLKIKGEDECRLDLLTLGECMIRLSPPGHGRLEFASTLEVWVGGGEYNVAYAGSRLGLRTGWVGRLVENPLGHLIRNHARAAGVDTSNVVWVPYDGVGKRDRIGLNFTEVGTGVRASVTIYDRGHSATSHMKPGEVNWKKIFSSGVRWFHTGGIFTALSETCAQVAKEALEEAHKAGVVTSYDLNFRSKLWSSEQAQKTTKGLVEYVDVLIGNEEDFEKVLGFKVKGVDEAYRKLDVESYKRMVKEVVQTYPHIQVIATTLREVVSGLLNNWSAILYYDGKFYESKRYENLEIEDRVGGGDGFTSGLIYGFLKGMTPQETVEFGAAHGALLQSTRGDTSQVTLEEVKYVAAGGTARIKR
jgi:2-dehydro-3-deoxygluconokinase